MKTETQSTAPARWKAGDEFLPYHPQASHVSPDYRDGWNACFLAAKTSAAPQAQSAKAIPCAACETPGACREHGDGKFCPAAPQAQPVAEKPAAVVLQTFVGSEAYARLDRRIDAGTNLYLGPAQAQPVREPMSWDLFVAACEAEYGEEFCPNNLGDVSDEEKAELMRVVSIVERHHDIGGKGGDESKPTVQHKEGQS